MSAGEERAGKTSQAGAHLQAVARQIVDRSQVIGIRAMAQAKNKNGESDRPEREVGVQ